jgi:hypothetical protein
MGCARPAPRATVERAPAPAICYACFWEQQDPGFRRDLIAFYERYETDDPLVRADVEYLLGRVLGDPDRVCASWRALLEIRDELADPQRVLLADEMLAFGAAECGEDPAPQFLRAATSAREAGSPRKATVYDQIAGGRFRPRFGSAPIERRLDVPVGATRVVLGRSAIRVEPGAHIGVQSERTVRDWLSYQMRYDFAARPGEATELLDYHEGARLRDVLAATPATIEPLLGTLVARREGTWYAPDETGVFRFEVLPDKVGELGLLVDTHGLSAIVVQAIERGVSLVVGCGDYTAKAAAAQHLARAGIDVYFPCDRFVGELIGYVGEGVLIGSAPVRSEGGAAIIGDRPLELRLDETIVVEDTSLGGRTQYYDAAARYFRSIAESVPLALDFVAIDGAGESARVVERAEALGAAAIALRVETEEDYRPVRDWLASSREHRAVLFHTAPYPAGYRLFTEFPEQTTFGDPRPVFLTD